MNRNVILLGLGFLALRPGSRVYAAQFLVSNPKEVMAAVVQAQPGDTILLRDGIWQDADLLFKATGAETQPITLKAENPGAVVLSGTSRLRIAGAHLVVQGLVFRHGTTNDEDVIVFREVGSTVADHCRLTECAMVDYTPADQVADTKWVVLHGASNRVDHCYFSGKSNSGPLLWVAVSGVANRPNHHRIDHNYFGPRSGAGITGGDIIRVGTSDVSLNSSRTRVEHNYFNGCSGGIEIISSRSGENAFIGNSFVECEGALSLRYGNGCVVEANYFMGNGANNTGGVRIFGEDHRIHNNYFVDLSGTAGRSALTLMQGLEDNPIDGFAQVKNTWVVFNTFINCRSSLLIGLPSTVPGTEDQTTLAPSDCHFANNLVHSTNGSVLVNQRLPPLNLVWNGNIMFGKALGITANSGISQIDPQLVVSADGLWRSSANSPARGTAQGEYDYVTDDIDGQLRPQIRDVGCDQASLDPASRPRATAADVGPDWLHSQPTKLLLVSLERDPVAGWVLGANHPWTGAAIIQVSTNLVNWTDLKFITRLPSPITSADFEAAQLSTRFYRVKALGIDLNPWKLTLPVDTDRPGVPDEVLQPELALYENAAFFQPKSLGGGLFFRAPCGGVTTPGASYPRSELREMANAGQAPASWSTTQGTHTMEITQAITHLPDVKRHLVAGQIHDAADDVIVCRLENRKLFLEMDGVEGPVLTPNYQLGDVFTIRFVVQNGDIECLYNGYPVFTHHAIASGCYFKAGAYPQSNTTRGDRPDAFGEVVIYGLNLTHEP